VAADYPDGVRVAPSILSADFARLGEQVDAVLDAGARVIHVDVMDGHFVPPLTMGPLVVEALRAVRATGARAGLSLNPPTPLARVKPFLGLIDVLLVMSVNPGWGGQPIVPGSIERIADARRMRAESGQKFLLEVDGGIKASNAPEALAAGAEVLVAGSAVYGTKDYAAAIRALRG